MAQAALFLNGTKTGGRLLDIPDSIPELFAIVSNLFNFEVKHLYTSSGEEILKINTLDLDNEQLILMYVAGDEPFAVPMADSDQKNSVVSHVQKLSPFVDASGYDWVRLNVGGTYFTTSKTTLLKEPDSLLAKMFDENNKMNPSKVDEVGAYLLDRDPTYFRIILNYLRDGRLIFGPNINRDAILNEAMFLGIHSIDNNMKHHQKCNSITQDELDAILLERDSHHNSAGIVTLMMNTNFIGLELSGLNLSYINFTGSCFRGCQMFGTHLVQTNLKRCDFEYTDLRKSVFTDSTMNGANFTFANLYGSQLKLCNLEKSFFTGANLQDSVFENTNLKRATLANANLSGASFTECNLNKVILERAKFESAILIKCQLINADLTGATLMSTSLLKCNLTDVCLKGAKLREMSMGDFHMQGADMSGANLNDCNLTDCFLTTDDYKNLKKNGNSNICLMGNVDFSGSDLQGCDLKGSCLVGVDWAGANVKAVIIEEDKKAILRRMAE